MNVSFDIVPLSKIKKHHPLAIIKGNDDNKSLFDKFLITKEDKTGKNNISIPSDMLFIPLPDFKKRDVYYIVGASGCGKSYMALRIAQQYRRAFPTRPIYLISKLEKDDTLDQLEGMSRLDFSNWHVQTPPIDAFKDSLVIFDDFDAVEKKTLKGIITVSDDIAITGRHTNTSMIYISHYLSNYSQTRLILNEATKYIIYPHATAYHPLYYLLNKYVGMDKTQIKHLKRLQSRWCLIHKNFPNYVISERNAYLLNSNGWDE